MEFSQKVNQLKEDLQHDVANLERLGKMKLKQTTVKAKQVS